jgi:predicted HTH transcriptional regulator/DNA-binding CsgD family transcriptional regulator
MPSQPQMSIEEIAELLDIEDLSESTYIEIKKAAGEDGRGQLPESIFPTYSAFANTQGGILLLGFQEVSPGEFVLTGITEPGRVIDQLWSNLNNREKVSINILKDDNVSVSTHDGKQFIRIVVPQARREQKPVYVGKNPLTGTFRRNFSGDYLCDESTVKRMIAEQVEESRDAKLLSHFTENDLDSTTLRSYRNRFRSTKPTHPWNSLDDREFLRSIGGLTRERASGEEGLTLAGLLMFGKLRPILDAVPYYLPDYQERRAEDDDGTRWVDRVTTDGTWSGNLYDFFQIVIQKLYRDLKVPFKLDGPSRIDDTPVHEALREALTNTLVHADYSGTVPILIIKRPDMFYFRNPGTMRVPVEDAIRGGVSDCRNRNLQTMFDLIGYGERAGSGLPKIFQNWREQLWRLPELKEKFNPEQTILVMRMMSLLPDAVMKGLESRFGSEFNELSKEQKLALATVAIEGSVTHARIKEISDIHPHDLSMELKDLVTHGFLQSAGATRAMVYTFTKPSALEAEDTIQTRLDEITEQKGGSSVHLPDSSVHLVPSSVHLPDSSVHSALRTLVDERFLGRKKVSNTLMEETILMLCSGHFLTLDQLADLLKRSPETIRTHYLNQMVKRKLLELKYPDKITHPDQGYRTRQ